MLARGVSGLRRAARTLPVLQCDSERDSRVIAGRRVGSSLIGRSVLPLGFNQSPLKAVSAIRPFQAGGFQIPSMMQEQMSSEDERNGSKPRSSVLKPKFVLLVAATIAAVYNGQVVYCAPATKISLQEVTDDDDEDEVDGDGEVVVDLTAALENAGNCVGERLCGATKVGYSSGINQVKVWLKKAKLAEHINADGNLIVPLPGVVVKQYFGDNSYHKLKPGQTVREKKAYSTVNGYRSAIKDHYSEREVCNADQLTFDEFVQPFLAGWFPSDL